MGRTGAGNGTAEAEPPKAWVMQDRVRPRGVAVGWVATLRRYGESSARRADPHYLDPVALHGESGQLAELGQRSRVQSPGQIQDHAARKAPRVGVWVRTAVVTGRAIPVGQLGGELAADQRFQGLVDGGKRDVGDHLSNGREDLVGGGVPVRVEKMTIHRGPLLGESLAVGLESLAETPFSHRPEADPEPRPAHAPRPADLVRFSHDR
jgi:hypothetical protein